MSTDDISLGFGGLVATFVEKAAYSKNMCSLCIMFICNFGCFPFCFRGCDFGSDCISS